MSPNCSPMFIVYCRRADLQKGVSATNEYVRLEVPLAKMNAVSSPVSRGQVNKLNKTPAPDPPKENTGNLGVFVPFLNINFRTPT